MRVLLMFVAVIFAVTLAACAAPDDGSDQGRRSQTGPYIGGGGGVSF
jgi:hypothetical protein